MNTEEITQTVLSYITTEYLTTDEEIPGPDSPLISAGIVDSFSMVSLKRFLENLYNIRIPDHRATPEAFDSVNAIAALAAEYLEHKEPSS